MTDLISRAAALDVLVTSPNFHTTLTRIEELPAVPAVPVVFCKDCKYWYAEIGASTGWLPCQEIATDRNWHCASGKRRDSE